MNPLLNPHYFAGVFLLYWVRRPFLSISGVVIFSFLYQFYLRDYNDGWRLLGSTAPHLFSEARIYGGLISLSLLGTVEALIRFFTNGRAPLNYKRLVNDCLPYAAISIIVVALLAYAPFLTHQNVSPTAYSTKQQGAETTGVKNQEQTKGPQSVEEAQQKPSGRYESLTDIDLSGHDKEKFSDFIRNHHNEIIYLRAWTDQKSLSENQGDFTLSLKNPSCHEDFGCSGVSYIFSMMKPTSGGSIGWVQGNYMIDGFFLITPIYGMHQGWVEVKLEELKRSEIILKMGSPPK